MVISTKANKPPNKNHTPNNNPNSLTNPNNNQKNLSDTVSKISEIHVICKNTKNPKFQLQNNFYTFPRNSVLQLLFHLPRFTDFFHQTNPDLQQILDEKQDYSSLIVQYLIISNTTDVSYQELLSFKVIYPIFTYISFRIFPILGQNRPKNPSI